MNDEELDARLRRWGEAQRAAAPPVTPTTERRGARRVRVWPVAAAAAVVLAVAGGVTAAELSGSSPPAPVVSGSSAPAPSPYATLPTTKQIVFHGLAVTVPSGWRLNATRCGIPVRDTVVLPGPVPACGLVRPPEVSSVQFSASDLGGLAGTLTGPVTRTGTLAGQDATWLTGTDRGFHVAAVTVPALHAQVVVSSPDAATVQRIAASVTIVATDDNGCAARSDATDVLPTGHAPSRAGADSEIVPDGATTLTICRYVAGYLEQSVRLTHAQAKSLVAGVNGLPRGVSRANPKEFLPSLCRKVGATSYPADTSDTEGYLIEASYPSGPPVDIVVRLALCGDLGASNGTVTGQLTPAFAAQVSGLAGNSTGWPSDVLPK